jgi:Mg2+ and Co2+ transporter CorA
VDGNPIAQLKSHLRRYVQVEERLAARYESATRAEDYFRILEEAVPHQRAARNMWLALQAAREAIPDDRDLIELRNVAGDIDRTMELLLKDTQNAVDFDIARTAEEQAQFSKQAAQAGHKLNVLASLFFPLTAVAGVLGMNLPTGLETSPIWVSWGVIGAAVLTGFLLLSWINGRDGT